MFVRLSLKIGVVSLSLIHTDRGLYIHGVQLARLFGHTKPHDFIDTIEPKNYLNMNSPYISSVCIRHLVTTKTFNLYTHLLDHINKITI